MDPSPQRPRLASRPGALLLSAAILSVALWARLADLYRLPVFVDESNHLIWAQRFSVGDTTYPIFMDGKLLLGVTLAQFRVLGPGPLWLARAAIALLSVVSCAACIAGGKLLKSTGAGLLAGVLYAWLPYALFHERQVLADPLTASFGAVALVLTLLLARARRPWLALPLGAALAAAVLSKFSGVLYLAFPFFAAILLPPTWAGRRKLAGRYAAAVAISAALVLAFLTALSSRWGYDDRKLASQQIGFASCPPAVCGGDLGLQLDNLRHAAGSLLDLIPPYFGWPAILLAILAWPVSPAGGRRQIAVVGLSALAILLALVATARDIPPRYVSPLAVPLAVLAAVGIVSIGRRASRALTGAPRRAASVGTAAALLAAMAIWPGANSAPLVLDPERAALPSLDRQAYITSEYGGTGVREAALSVLGREAAAALPPAVVVGNLHLPFVQAYFDRTRVDVREVAKVGPTDIGRWLSAGQSIYIFDQVQPDRSLPTGYDDPLDGLVAADVGYYPRMGGAALVRLRKVGEAGPALRGQIFAAFFVDPAKLPEAYDALASALGPPAEGGIVLAYPPHQLPMLAARLAGRPHLELRAIGDSWPLDARAVDRELTALTAGRRQLDVVFLEETIGDPGRHIETWLNTNLFRVGEQWFGPVRLARFAGSGGVAQSISVEARFGGGIALESVEVLDPAARPGGLVRLRLHWQASAPIAQNLKAFAHIFAGEGIVAQHDGQPVGELRPTTTWQPGERIVDQFAIALPADARPGSYRLRIGLYDLDTQARLPALLADGTAAEFFVGGQVVVLP